MLKKLYLFASFFCIASCMSMEMEIDTIQPKEQNYFATQGFIQEVIFPFVKNYKVNMLEDLHSLKRDLGALLFTCKSFSIVVNKLIKNYETDQKALAFNELLLTKQPKLMYEDERDVDSRLKDCYFYALLGTLYGLEKIDKTALGELGINSIKFAFEAEKDHWMLSHDRTFINTDSYGVIKTNERFPSYLVYKSFASLFQKFPRSSQFFLNKILQKENEIFQETSNFNLPKCFIEADLNCLQEKYGKIEDEKN